MVEEPASRVSLKRKTISIFSLGLLLMVVLEVMINWLSGDWGRIQPGWTTQILGAGLTFTGIVLIIWSVISQYKHGNGTPVPKVATQKLVTRGPYSYTRNPMTLGALFFYSGTAIWLSSGLLIMLCVIIFSLLLAFIHKHETRELAQRFGKEYLDYCSSTPFLFPNFRRKTE